MGYNQWTRSASDYEMCTKKFPEKYIQNGRYNQTFHSRYLNAYKNDTLKSDLYAS